MRGRSALLVAGLAIAGVVAASAPAGAAPIDKGRFHDTSSDSFMCGDTLVLHDNDVWINFNFNQRGGKNVFPYYRESVEGRDVFTNTDNGGTYSEHFTSNVRDHKIVDNGDGTITIYSQGSGTDEWFDTNGNKVLMDTGQFRWSIVIDYAGTPGDPSDDVEVPDSFQVVRESTGRNDLVNRDFCADLFEFTS
jgi:hypothetical protein